MDFLETNFKWVLALLALIIVYKFFKDYLINQNKKHYFYRNNSIKSDILAVKLQAYERLTLFLERMTPTSLLIRVQPISTKKEDYEQLLIKTIEQEFEHNLSQQIYLSKDCWNVILTAKNTTIQSIINYDILNTTKTADKFRELILTKSIDSPSPTSVALAYLKNEASKLIVL
tara:strand:+ start:502 stop:1020 length:519 start_codon:yes stop_codon:yes gene_type:complete